MGQQNKTHLEALIQAGRALATLCYNLKQLALPPLDWRESLHGAVSRWDDAYATYLRATEARRRLVVQSPDAAKGKEAPHA